MMKPILRVSAALAVMTFSTAAFAEACDLAKGEKVFKRCKACHKLEDGKNGVGPHLFGIVGRDVGGVDGYKYSDGMKKYGAADEVWDASRLDAFVTKPKKEVKGTKMAFGGLKKDKQRADLICYLETIK